MSNLIDKVMNLVGWEDEEYYEEVETKEEEPVFTKHKTPSSSSLKKQNKVVNIHSQGHFKMVILQPEDFEQAREITEHLKNKKPVVINVEGVDKPLAQRIVDFLCGSIYALNGNIQKISNGIFLIAPHNVDIMGGRNDEVNDKGAFPWIK